MLHLPRACSARSNTGTLMATTTRILQRKEQIQGTRAARQEQEQALERAKAELTEHRNSVRSSASARDRLQRDIEALSTQLTGMQCAPSQFYPVPANNIAQFEEALIALGYRQIRESSHSLLKANKTT
jgi:uncharacterized protein YcbK (DUF882 family)